MASPIPYTVKSGENLQDIAKNLGIKDWTLLKDYHKQNGGETTSDIPYVGFILQTPPEEEVFELNGETPPLDPVEEQNTAEQKQEAEKKKEDKKEEDEKLEKGEHDGKYFVVHNAKCVCDQSEPSMQTANLQVTSHKIIVFNDQAGKFVATEEDKTFVPPASTFGLCRLQPLPSGGYKPCKPSPAPKWSKTYESTKVEGKNTLTEISELQCIIGGKITIHKHGQTDSVSTAHADNTDPLELAMVNPAVEMPKKKDEFPSVSSISITEIEDRKNFKEQDSKEKRIIYLRKNEEASFRANLSKGNKQLTSWMVYSDHAGSKENRLLLREQIGTEFSQSFGDLGKFRVEGYGKPKKQDFEKGKYDKCDATCSIDIEVVENKLQNLGITSNDYSSRIDNSKKIKFRKGVPTKIRAEFFIQKLTEEEKGRLTMIVEDGEGNTIPDTVKGISSITFIPKNSKATYVVKAKYTTESGEIIEKELTGESEGNVVMSISHSAEVVRPGTAMSFSVTKMRFSIDEDEYKLTPEESSAIKWNLNNVQIGTGSSINIPGNKLLNVGKYVVEAFSMTANAGKKHEEDDWHFEVKQNDVVSFSLSGTPKVGKAITATVDKMVFADLLANEIIHWKGFSQNITGKSITITPKSAGTLSISCSINNRKGVTQNITIVQPSINDIMFTDSLGNKIEKASWGQKVNIWIDQKYLVGEKINLVLWDDDMGPFDDPVKTISIGSYDGALISLDLDTAMKKEAGDHGLIYGKLSVPGLTAKGEEIEFPKNYKLDVKDVPEVYNAILGNADGKEKHTIVDYDEISYLYAHSRGIKPTENLYLEIRDSVFGKDPLMLYQGNVKADASGIIRQKIVWNNIKKKVNLLTVYAIIKLKDSNGKVLYDADGDFSMATAKLMKGSTLTKMAGYTSAVKVGDEKVPQQTSENEICECEARVRAYMRMLRVGEGTGELIKSSKYNKETKKNEIVYIPHDFESGYTKLFGGGNFTKAPNNKDMSSHPQIKVLWYTKKNGEKVYSSAAGAYQVMGYTWSDNNMINKRKTYNVKDFSPEGQDKFCVVLFKHKRAGMLDLIIKDNIKGATETYGSYEWASLPPGRYGQPIETMEKALELYDKFYKEELADKSPLHLQKGFLKEFGYDCCKDAKPKETSLKNNCGKTDIDLRSKIKWQTQFDSKWGDKSKQNSACKKTCDDILINSGLKATSLSNLFQTALENSLHTVLNINSAVSKTAVEYLDAELEKGHPVQVGVDHGLGYKINNNADHSTDHFVVIVGRGCENNKCYYIFYDVGTSYKEKGSSDNNKLFLDTTDYSLKGKTVYNGNFYTVTQIRKN